MDKRFLYAIALCVLILVGWQTLMQRLYPPPPEPPPGVRVEGNAPAPAETSPAGQAAPGADSPAVTGSAPQPAPTEPIAPVAAEAPEEVVLENALMRVLLTNKGGRASSWELKGYRAAGDAVVNLVPAYARRDDLLPLAIETDDGEITKALTQALYKVERTSAAEGGGESVRFTWSDGRGLEASKTLTIRPDDPLVDLEVSLRRDGRDLPARVTWGPGFEANDAPGSATIHFTGQAVLLRGAKPERFARSGFDEEIRIGETEGLRWVGLEEQYFTALFLPAGSKGSVALRPASVRPVASGEKDGEPKPVEQILVAVGLPEGKAQIYVGAKKYSILHKIGLGLEKVVWFSNYDLIGWFAKYLFLALLWIHDTVVANYGFAIILATIALRVALFPLNQYSMLKMRRTAAEMQKVQPKLKAIQKKYRGSKDPNARQKLNEETMELYRREGVNPFGGVSGCLPILIQFPILIGFYNVLTVAVELRGAPFVAWIHDLTLKDPFFVAPILMGATMLWQQRITPVANPDPMQQKIMMFMPIMFTVMFLNLPSGLVLYWFVNNLLGIGQQWLVNRHFTATSAAPQEA